VRCHARPRRPGIHRRQLGHPQDVGTRGISGAASHIFPRTCALSCLRGLKGLCRNESAGLVNDVLAVAAAAGEPIVLAGHSSGAVVALEAALASPAQVAGMVPRGRPRPVRRPRRSRAAPRGRRSPKHLRVRLGALAAVLPDVDSLVILLRQGHLANARAPARSRKSSSPSPTGRCDESAVRNGCRRAVNSVSAVSR
jgi:pimeloyl-ACP methyl ester carboxylesterase